MTFLSDEASRNGTGWKHQKEHYYECAVEKQEKLPCDTVETLRRGKKIIGEVGCGQAWFLQDPVDLIEKIWSHSLQVPCNSKHHWGIMIPKSWTEDGWIIALIYKQRGDTLPSWGPRGEQESLSAFPAYFVGEGAEEQMWTFWFLWLVLPCSGGEWLMGSL